MNPLGVVAKAAGPLLGRELTAEEVSLFDKYLRLLVKWQSSQRLVGSADPAWIAEHVLADSLAFVPILGASASSLIDIGSGAGIPGIPIKIACRGIGVTLLEARRRRISFLRTAVRELGLPGLEVVDRRLEDAAEELAGRFDVAVMRCAGPWEGILDDALRVVRPGGRVIASGPPNGRPLGRGEWVEVRLGGGVTRQFALYTKP